MRRAGLCMVIFLTVLLNANSQSNIFPTFRSSKIFTDAFYKDGTKGSRYFFDSGWVKGSILSANNSVISNDSFWLNLDKISQNIYLTEDFRNIVQIDKKEFKSVTFYRNDSAYVFEHVNLINGRKLFQSLVKSEGHYSLFKLIRTGLKKIYYTAKDPREGERNYDEYVDAHEYYIVFPSKEIRSFYNLKKNNIERIFSLHLDGGKVNDYFASHPADKIDEAYLKNLILYLNQQIATNTSNTSNN